MRLVNHEFSTLLNTLYHAPPFAFKRFQEKGYNMTVKKKLKICEIFVNFDMRDFEEMWEFLSLGDGKTKSGALPFYALSKNLAIMGLNNMLNNGKT